MPNISKHRNPMSLDVRVIFPHQRNLPLSQNNFQVLLALSLKGFSRFLLLKRKRNTIKVSPDTRSIQKSKFYESMQDVQLLSACLSFHLLSIFLIFKRLYLVYCLCIKVINCRVTSEQHNLNFDILSSLPTPP